MDLFPQIRHQPEAKMILTQALCRSLEILQMPQMDLALLIQEETEKNPLLEIETESNSSKECSQEISSTPSIFDAIMTQIRENFMSNADRKIAELFLQYLDEKGFITDSLEEICHLHSISLSTMHQILKILQSFDPPGIFARNLQESFLLQLERSKQEKTLAFRIIKEAYEDFLQGRYSILKKKFQASPLELRLAIRKLARLSSRPRNHFNTEFAPSLDADLRFVKTGNHWKIESVESKIPKFRLRVEYLGLRDLPPQHQETLRNFIVSGKWLLRSIERRRKLLLSIGAYLAKKQSRFLEGKAPLTSISIAELSSACSVHESTISRALSDKYIEIPNGIIPLRSLIASSNSTHAKEIIHNIIRNENKATPVTDEQLVEQLRNRGILIARRTVTKYRQQLKISSASSRKHIP